jgi:hypothetical protein
MCQSAFEQIMYNHNDNDKECDNCKKFRESPKYMVDAFFSGIIEYFGDKGSRCL